MKKIIALVLAGMMVVGCLSGCGSTAEETVGPASAATEAATEKAAAEAPATEEAAGKPFEGRTVSATFYTFVDEATDTAFWNEIKEGFKEETGADFEFILTDTGSHNAAQIANLAAGEGTDILHVTGGNEKTYYLKPFIETGVETVMFDDDFRMNFNDHGPLCFCDIHMKRYEKRLGHPVTREEMRSRLLSGTPNEYRDAWLEESRITLIHFAEELRKAADEINPDCRLSLSSGPALWGLDGAMSKDGLISVEISKILAGKKTPQMRLTGSPMFMAPYFQGIFKHRTMAQTIEFSRMQAALCKDSGVSVFAENDSFPRPRYVIPAAYLNLFEMVSRADGNFTGSQNYMVDYNMEFDYETGYLDSSAEQQELFSQISDAFDGKTLTGITVFHPLDNLRYRTFMHDGCEDDLEVETSNVPGQRYLTDNSVTAVYEGDGPAVVFGSDAEQCTAEILGQGVILDLEAAEILTNKGIDVGLISVKGSTTGKIIGDIELGSINFEYYIAEDSKVPIHTPVIRFAEISEKAQLLSTFIIGKNTSPASYRYENAQGQKFYVLAFDARENMFHDGMFRCYHRQKHLIEAFEWLTGRKLDAVCRKHPDLYMITKKDESSLAVGLWNFSADYITEPIVELGGKYSSVSGINCEAVLEGNVVRLSKLHAYEFAGFVVKK